MYANYHLFTYISLTIYFTYIYVVLQSHELTTDLYKKRISYVHEIKY